MDSRGVLPVHGFVLAGGKSSRMGSDKALLELAGKPLLEHAVVKLRRICEQVSVLGERTELEGFAPLVPDVHPRCGPIGGIEAALLHAGVEWSLILPVDVPFLPTALLYFFARSTVLAGGRGARIGMFVAEGVPQPALLMVHRDVLPFLSRAIGCGAYKLYPVLEAAGRELSKERERQGLAGGEGLRVCMWDAGSRLEIQGGSASGAGWKVPTEAQQRARPLWFMNVNTLEDFAETQRNAEALDT